MPTSFVNRVLPLLILTICLAFWTRPAAAQAVINQEPIANAVGVTLTTPIRAQFSTALDAASVISRSFAVHSFYRGLITGSLTVVNDTVTLTPSRPLLNGEQVQTVATLALKDTSGGAMMPTQWGFTAGTVKPRCANFTESKLDLTPVAWGTVAWGDYDNDGDLDLLLMGDTDNSGSSFTPTTKLYRNDTGALVDSGVTLAAVVAGAAAWGDYDNDGDLDLALTGSNGGVTLIAKLYRNEAGSFVDTGAELTSVATGALAWGDYDNDGDLDLALTGQGYSAVPVTKLYRNDDGNLSDSGVSLQKMVESRAVWGDYDNDGDLDLLLAGDTDPEITTSNPVTKLYRNDAGNLVESGVTLPGVRFGAITWGDYDSDGDLDLAIAGATGRDWGMTLPITKIYRNQAGNLVDSGIPLPGVAGVALSWGDYDNDGALDLLLIGENNSLNLVAKLYHNEQGSFFDSGLTLPGVTVAATGWGDYDNDGDLDFLFTGAMGNRNLNPVVKLYRNNDCPTLTIGDAVVDESMNSTLLNLSLNMTSNLTITVAYQTVDATATANDYNATSGLLTIPPGQISATIPISIINDTLVEGIETFSVTLNYPMNATLSDSVGSVTIHDNDQIGLAIDLVKLEPITVTPGAVVIWQLTLSNTGNVDITVDQIKSVVATPGVQVAQVAAVCTTPGQVIQLAAQKVHHCTFNQTISGEAGQTFNFQVEVTARGVGNLPIHANDMVAITLVTPIDRIYLPIIKR